MHGVVIDPNMALLAAKFMIAAVLALLGLLAFDLASGDKTRRRR